MDHPQHRRISPTNPRRKSTQGVVLIATLATLILLTGIVAVFQSEAITNARILSILRQDLEENMGRDEAYERLRPVIGAAMFNPREPGAVALNGTPFVVETPSYIFDVRAQDVNGLVNIFRTPENVARELLPPSAFTTFQSVQQRNNRGRTLRELIASAPESLSLPPDLEFTLTAQSSEYLVNRGTMPSHYLKKPGRPEDYRQTQDVVLQIDVR